MKNKKLLKLSALLISAFMLVGCGENPEPTPGPSKTYYTVTFMNGDSVYTTKQAEANDVVERPTPDPEKEGFEFLGWYTAATEGTKWSFATDVVTKNMSLYAQYEADQVDYTVKIYNGSTLVDTKITDSKSKTEITLPQVEVAEGKSHLGFATVDGRKTAADVEFRKTIAFADVAAKADANHVLNLYAVIKDGAMIALDVAVWSRYITEANFNVVYDAFKEHMKTTNIAYDFLDYTYYEPAAAKGDAYYETLDFSTVCKDTPRHTVAFPTGKAFRGSKSAFPSSTELPHHLSYGTANIFGVADRYISCWTDDALTLEFTSWMYSLDAIKIMDPDYTPTYPVEEASDKNLVIGVWGRWLTKEHADSVLEAYKTYAAEAGVNYDDVKIQYYDGATSSEAYYAKASYIQAIAANPAIDVILPTTLAIASGSDSDCEFFKLTDKVTKTINLGTGDDGLNLVIDGQSDRAMATLNADALTDSFYNFILTEAGKKALDPSYSEIE